MPPPTNAGRTSSRRSRAIGLVFTAALSAGCAAPAQLGPASTDDPRTDFTQDIEGTSIRLEMVFVQQPGTGAGPARPLWISRTEIPWDLFDVFVFGLDTTAGVDAVTRPSKPYIAMDRGFGHGGYPAISMSYRGAEAFCNWLSAKTGRTYRLPTESEWRAVCAAASPGAPSLDQRAWHAGNSGRTTHPTGGKSPDGLGLSDLLGNASEWCTGDDGEPVTLGGTYLTAAAEIDCTWRVLPTAAWNASDPQFPKSVWWLADAGFVGFRVVCVSDDP